MIAGIRSTEETAQARTRLMAAFDLSETQTNYILEMPLRRLTRFSRIELETERDQLTARIAELTEILENPEQLRAVVVADLAELVEPPAN